jgi:hypothetical protein
MTAEVHPVKAGTSAFGLCPVDTASGGHACKHASAAVGLSRCCVVVLLAPVVSCRPRRQASVASSPACAVLIG